MLKGALVGFGSMGGGHFGAHRGVTGSQLVALCDIRQDMAREKLAALGADLPVYGDMEQMIRECRPDYLDLVTPTYTHPDLAIKAMEMGCHVLCEKPMALNEADCQRMIEASQRTGRRLMVAHVVRFMAPYAYLKRAVEDRRLGRLLRLDMERFSAIPRTSWGDWMQDFEKSGGVILDLSIHDIDFARYLLGEPAEISGYYYTQKDLTEYAAADLFYEGAVLSARSGWYKADIPFRCNYQAIFENGIIEAAGDRVQENGCDVVLDPAMPELAMGFPCDTLDGYLREIQYFVHCLAAGAPFDAVEADSSRKTVALCRKIIAGARPL